MASTLILAACGVKTGDGRLAASDAGQLNPAFLRKLALGDAYVVDRTLGNKSICGRNDLQHINDYNGSLGQTVAYAQLHQGAVGATAALSGSTTRKYCSGTLIGPDLYLTASHCVDSNTTNDYVVMNYEKAVGSSAMLPEERFKIKEVVENGNSIDYAVVRVEGNPGYKYGWTPVRASAPTTGEGITIIQHPNGEAKMIEGGTMKYVTGDYMYYGDVDTQPGSSGSGILDAEGNVFGVHTNGGCTASGGENSGTRINAATHNSHVLARLGGMTLGFGDGAELRITVGTSDGEQTLDVDGSSVVVTSVGKTSAQTWTVQAAGGGAYVLVNGGACLAARADGSLALSANAAVTNTACHWQILKTETGGYLLRTLTPAQNGRWLNAANRPHVGSSAQSWGITVL